MNSSISPTPSAYGISSGTSYAISTKAAWCTRICRHGVQLAPRILPMLDPHTESKKFMFDSHAWTSSVHVYFMGSAGRLHLGVGHAFFLHSGHFAFCDMSTHFEKQSACSECPHARTTLFISSTSSKQIGQQRFFFSGSGFLINLLVFRFIFFRHGARGLWFGFRGRRLYAPIPVFFGPCFSQCVFAI